MNKLWIVGKNIENIREGVVAWEFQGVFDTKEKAVKACWEDSYFIGPAFLNETLSDDLEVWPGCWYPHRQDDPDKE